MQFFYVVNIFLFLFSAFENLWKKHRMNANRDAINGTDSKFADDELDVYNLDEDQLWTSSELEEMRQRRSSQTKKSSTGSDMTKAIEEEPETAPKKKASRVNASGATPGEESRPDFYHGVGPYNDVNLPGVWFFRIPHKVIGSFMKPRRRRGGQRWSKNELNVTECVSHCQNYLETE